VLLGEVVNQLLDQHGLADPGAAEQPDLAALGVWRQQIDHLDARLEHFRRRAQILDPRRLLVDLAALGSRRQILAEIDRLAEQVEDASQRRLADRHRDRSAGVDHLRTAREPVGRVHRDRPHAIVAEMLLDLAHQHRAARLRADARRLLAGGGRGARDGDRMIDLWEPLGEHGLDHHALDLLDASDVCARPRARARALGRAGLVNCGADRHFSLDSPISVLEVSGSSNHRTAWRLRSSALAWSMGRPDKDAASAVCLAHELARTQYGAAQRS
jgi:hypothetical protein